MGSKQRPSSSFYLSSLCPSKFVSVPGPSPPTPRAGQGRLISPLWNHWYWSNYSAAAALCSWAEIAISVHGNTCPHASLMYPGLQTLFMAPSGRAPDWCSLGIFTVISLDTVLKTKVIFIFIFPLPYLQLLVLDSFLRTAALLTLESWSCVFAVLGE